MKRDLMRVIWLLLLGLLLVVIAPAIGRVIDTGLSGVLYSVGIVILIAGFSHVTRRILMPRLDFQRLAERAVQEPTGAGIAFLGFCYLLSTLIQAGIVLMR